MIRKTCDRCGESGVPMKPCGIVTMHDYCRPCEDEYKIYMKQVDKLQEALAEEWEKSLAEIREEFLCIK